MARRSRPNAGSLRSVTRPAPLRAARKASAAPTESRPAHRPPRGAVAASAEIKFRVMPAVKAGWQAAADRAGQTLSAWMIEAAELAIARGSTR